MFVISYSFLTANWYVDSTVQGLGTWTALDPFNIITLAVTALSNGESLHFFEANYYKNILNTKWLY
ncbi:MAG: hypothetical protein RAO94_00740 [Candidatus Stygibacter australis]|nr:hypothetical protein [Candidatus Stygibacter australis]MDP8320854.1 hypothetical protein [Candidatus Stygibacter australis]